MAEHKEHQKEAKAEKEAVAKVVNVKFLRGVDAEGKQVFETREVNREIAEAELAKPVKVEDVKEGEPVKLRNSAFIGAEIVK